MDLNTVTSYRRAYTRGDLVLAAGERFVAGGTWMFSEPQEGVTGLVDLTTMGWPALQPLVDGLRIGATCTIREVAKVPPRPEWAAGSLFPLCASALLASFKIWNVATVGGNVCQSLSAAAMVSLCVALDATALVWTPDGGERRVGVEGLVTGNGTNTLTPGEVLRAIDIPGYALRGRAGFRKIALAGLGRSGAVLTGRVDDDGRATFTITAATVAPTVLRYPRAPDAATLREDVEAAPGYYTDPLGPEDWRRAVSAVLLEEIRQELAG